MAELSGQGTGGETMTHLKRSLAGAAIVAIVAGSAWAQARTDLTVALQLEPPNLDPTGGAAGAIGAAGGATLSGAGGADTGVARRRVSRTQPTTSSSVGRD